MDFQNGNNEQNNYDQNGYRQSSFAQGINQGGYAGNDYKPDGDDEANSQKVFSEAAPEHLPQDVDKAKAAMGAAFLSLAAGVFEVFSILVLHRISYMLSLISPIVAVVSVVMAINVIRSDKGIAKAYIGLIAGIVAVIPGLICVLLMILNFIA